MSVRDEVRTSWLEASARERVSGLLDAGSFVEFLGPEQRHVSPHLGAFDLPVAFDDGAVVGRGTLDGEEVLVGAQEGRFMGGTFGEVSGAKLVGLVRAAVDGVTEGGARTVLLLLDTGGVRLQEANAGELSVSELIRAICEARRAGVAVIALAGGKAGAFGGGGIVTASCSRVVVSQHGRIGVSGPEVIETNKGVEEFDSKDRALVWRVTGGRTRRLIGGADAYSRDDVAAFREAAIVAMRAERPAFDAALLRREQERLSERSRRLGACTDAPAIWNAFGIDAPELVADLDEERFAALADTHGAADVAR